jgi:Cu(I)/Ag(I) efflux system membrane fusion protein
VQLGVKVESGFQALSGVAEGDRLVTSANFLLDSESSLRAALQAMGTPEPRAPGQEPQAPAPQTPAPAHRH